MSGTSTSVRPGGLKAIAPVPTASDFLGECAAPSMLAGVCMRVSQLRKGPTQEEEPALRMQGEEDEHTRLSAITLRDASALPPQTLSCPRRSGRRPLRSTAVSKSVESGACALAVSWRDEAGREVMQCSRCDMLCFFSLAATCAKSSSPRKRSQSGSLRS